MHCHKLNFQAWPGYVTQKNFGAALIHQTAILETKKILDLKIFFKLFSFLPGNTELSSSTYLKKGL